MAVTPLVPKSWFGLGVLLFCVVLDHGRASQGACGPCRCFLQQTGEKLFRGMTANCTSRNLTTIPDSLLRYLLHLDLSHNEITEVTRLDYPRLKTLKLINNNLTAVSERAFQETPYLQYLDLAGNRFNSLPEEVFWWARNLRTLRGLDVNQISAEPFQNLNRLRVLEIHTDDEYVFPEIFDALYIEKLELHLRRSERLTRTLLVSLKTTLRDLTLVAGELLRLDEGMFKELILLNKIYIEAPKVENLPGHLFEGDTVPVDGNDPQPEGDATPERTKNLKDITLVGVRAIPDPLFHQLIYLERLRINNAAEIPAELFKNLKRLNLLDLSYNNISETEAAWFNDLDGLNKLNLSHNQLTHVGSHFHVLQSLRSLDLSRNNLSVIVEDAFVSIQTALEYLNLSWNHICTLPELVFDSLWSLEVLNLSHNCLRSLPNAIFGSLQKLRELYLQKNHLMAIDGQLFIGMQDLEVLNLSSNALQAIDAKMLPNDSALHTLDLSNNRIGLIPAELTRGQHSLGDVQLEGNTVVCSCGVLQLIQLHKMLGTAITGECIYADGSLATLLLNVNASRACASDEDADVGDDPSPAGSRDDENADEAESETSDQTNVPTTAATAAEANAGLISGQTQLPSEVRSATEATKHDSLKTDLKSDPNAAKSELLLASNIAANRQSNSDTVGSNSKSSTKDQQTFIGDQNIRRNQEHGSSDRNAESVEMPAVENNLRIPLIPEKGASKSESQEGNDGILKTIFGISLFLIGVYIIVCAAVVVYKMRGRWYQRFYTVNVD